MTAYAITGLDSAVGRALAARLAADPSVTRIVGIDQRTPPSPPAGLEFVRADLRDPVLARVLAGVDVVVHQGTPDDLGRAQSDPDAMTVQGTRQVLDAARTAGVGTIVHLSTALVYGAQETNRVPLREDVTARARPRFPAAYQALVAEESVRAFAAAHPDRRVVILRPVPVLGRGVDSPVTRHLESALLPLVRGFDPPVQFVDVDDLVAAVVTVASDERAAGIYNVAADGWLTTRDVRRLLARPTVHLPRETAGGVAALLHRCGLITTPPGALDYLMHPWVVDTSRLHALGWTPASGQRDILHRFVTDHRPWVTVGRIRMRTARLIAAVLGAGTAAAMSAAWLMWRRWLAPLGRRRGARVWWPIRRTTGRSSAHGSS